MKISAPLTKTQFGLYIECTAHPGEPCYNIPCFYVIDGSLNEERLKAAIETAVAAHPTLFTRIEQTEEGEPVQTIDDSETFSLTVEHVEDIEAVKTRLIQPFNILGDRLFHIRLLRDRKHFYLYQDVHHIIFDGASQNIMIADIEKAYRGEPLEPEALTLAQLAEIEEQQRQSPAFEEDKKWFAENFNCGDCYSPLLPDCEDAEPADAFLARTLAVDETRVDTFCKKHGIFRSTFFTAAYSFLLAKYNHEEEVLFNTIYNGRTDKRFNHSVGMTVKTVPVYAKFDKSTSVLDFLRAVQKQMAGCRQHDTYSYSDVVSDLGLRPATLFAWHAHVLDNTPFCGKPMQLLLLGNNTREVPLYLKAIICDGRFVVEAEYDANAYSESLINQFMESYEVVIEGFLSHEYLCDISIATSAQVELLDSFNQNDVPYDDTQTIVSLFRRQAKVTPDNIAVVYKDKRYTYAEVDEISDRIAGYIIDKLRIKNEDLGIGDESVVSILIPRCEWMAIASLGVLKAGCAYQPLDPTYPKERLNFMMQDANAKLLIADEELRSIVDEYLGEVLLTKDIAQLPAVPPQLIEPKSESLFILLYTSGSTGVPKGCQLTHGNLVAFCHWYQRYYNLQPEDHVAAYASYGFDACMMDMYPTLTCGATVHIIPEEIRLDLIALNDYFEHEHITHSFMTTQVGYQFATSIENHSLLHLSTGGEKLAAITPPTGYNFYNGYGPTECTIFTTTYLVDKKLKDIPIGKPLDNIKLYIVDEQGHRQPVGAAGELWVSGPQVSRGYLNRPEKTDEVFIENPFAGKSGNSGKYARCYRTGDIVRYLPSGDIQFVGRSDGQVKIRGFRIELKEVEAVIREFPGIKDATVQAFDVDEGEHQSSGGGKFIAAYVVSDEQIDIEALNNFILDQKPPYMVPAVTMQIDAIPLNQNQKVHKRALPKPVSSVAVARQQAAQAPLNMLEQELHDIIAGIVNNSDFGIITVLGYAGLTSISAIKLAVQVNKRYGVQLDAKSLAKTATLQSIENEILKGFLAQGSGLAVNATKVEANHEGSARRPGSQSLTNNQAPLSYAQTGVYVDCLNNPTSTIYNIPCLFSYPAGVEAEKLADAVKQTVEAHSELSVHFTTKGDTIVQTLDGCVPVEVPVVEMSNSELATHKQSFVRPFNLQEAPLYRLEVVKTESGIHLLMDIHHLIFDGASADLFIRQVNTILEGAAIEKESYTYFDFVADQQRAESGEAFKAAQQFFAKKLQTCEGASEIPADRPKTDRQGFIGEAVCPTDFDKAIAFCRQQEITPAHLFLAATSYVVSRYTNNREVYLCTISSGRSNLRIADTVGMFVNTLAIGIDIGDVSVSEFLHQTCSSFDETLRHEAYPFARIAADHDFRPAIAYAYQVGVLSEYAVGNMPVGQEVLELNVPKFKINPYCKCVTSTPFNNL